MQNKIWGSGTVEWDVNDYCTSQAASIAIVLSHEEIDDVEDNNNNLDSKMTNLDTLESMSVLGKNFHVTKCTRRTE